MGFSAIIRRIKCMFRGHRAPEGYTLSPGSDIVALCPRCGDPVGVVAVNPQPEPGPQPQPPDPPPVGDHIVTRISTWYGGHKHPGATVDSRFALVVRNNGRDWTAAPSDWRVGKAGPGCPASCNVMCCAAYLNAAGKWVGGKFDWNRPHPSPRAWDNVKSGYNGWVAPRPGTEMVCWCYTADGNRVSLEARTTYMG